MCRASDPPEQARHRPSSSASPVKVWASAGFLYEDPSVSGVLMTENDVQRFRSEAKECRRLAEQATSRIDKQAWLRLAEDWIKLAARRDARLVDGERIKLPTSPDERGHQLRRP